MKTVIKVTLGILIAFTILIGGCVALVGSAANDVQDENDRTAITPAQYRSIKTGDAKSEVEAELGDPESADEFSSEIEGLDKPVGSSCSYYGRKGELLSGYQFCFDVNTDELESKSSF
ncbi:hypothetical protein [Patulibacter sp.]|uniref:hypothetical protein n=1 Tax=Patulibacter sp. TaxID=1912859 RepID=UPI00271C9CAF|nr:hypothetical protein [Patulibacter sp.]MDO9410109.1 hypothetical protein [Patulibacter sp.]